MKEQIYVVRQRVAEGGGMEATVGSGCLADGVLWWSVLFPSGFITVLSLGAPHSQWERAKEAVRGCGPGTPATSDKINIRIRAQFWLLLVNVFQLLWSLTRLPCWLIPLFSLPLCFALCPFLPGLLSPLLPSFPPVLPDRAVIMGQ